MPRISISVTTADGTPADDTLNYELSLDLTILDLKSFVEAETGYAPEHQTFWLNGQPLMNTSQTLADAGIKDNEMLVLLIGPQPGATQRQTGSGPAAGNPAPGASEIEALRQRLLSDQSYRNQVIQGHPQIAAAINDPTRFHEILVAMDRERAQRQREAQAEMQRLNDDPFNPENQQKIAEMIRKQNVEQELSEAMQENPEFFARVTMLYVNVEVNGHPVKAFVDSGAQATIMSPSCAEACNIMRLIDDRYAGIAKGVGTAKILGRVHRANVKIGDAELPCSFTVMEGKDVDMLLGLDMLRRYQACIDLSQNKLIFAGGVSVPFLGESEIPRSFEEAMANEPTVEGPDGNAIGAVSGALKPSGTNTAPSSSAAAATAPSGSGNIGAGGSNFRGAGQTLGSSQPSQSRYPQATIEQLQSMGFSEQEVIAALDACDGNAEYAASLLFQN